MGGILLLSGTLAAVASPQSANYHFEIARASGALYNPWTQRDDPVELRSFVGSGASPGDFVAPTIRVAPGQRLRIDLDNKLEPCSEAQRRDHKCFNDTNLHTHGLWVSPSGNSDNVLISIEPGKQFRYEYDIPADHPAGTFWYHPHRHGSGFVQVGSGMAGALIVTGNRMPTATSPGDIDILLKDERGRALPERVLLFQQIHYGCLDDKGAIRGDLDKDENYVRPWRCNPGETGRIESPDNDWFWENSGRFTGINGKVQPSLTARAGGFERWRLIHGGTRDRIRLMLHRLDAKAPALRTVKAAEQEEWISKNCNGPALPMWLVAMDGLTRSNIRRTDVAPMFAGERLDLLAHFPTAGKYCLLQDSTVFATRPLPKRVIAILTAEGPTSAATDADKVLERQLIGAATRSLSGPVRDKVVGDLRNGLRLSSFVWHKPIPEEEVSNYREMTLNIIETSKDALFHVNGRPYDHHRIDHVLPLGKAEQWHLASLLGHHPLHMHVNPFQIVSITDGQDRDVTDPTGPAFDPDYAGLKGEWKDTVFVKRNHKVAFRTRYERFTGDFVTHCHIMFHGDAGMMQNLRIAAEGDPPAAHSGH